MKKYIFPLIIVTAFLAGCGDGTSAKKTAQATNATPNYNSGNPLTEPADYLGAVVQAQKYAEKTIDVSYINQDIQMFNASEGHYPKDLQEMIPNYLAKIPVVPFGYKLVYDTNSYTVKVVKQ
jgi:hypothetical protein